MPRKFQGPINQFEDVNFIGHMLTGTIFEVAGSGKTNYDLEIGRNGITCTCQGFNFRGKCKHIKAIADRLSGIETDAKISFAV